MSKTASQKINARHNSYSFTQIIDNIHIFIIQHQNFKLKLSEIQHKIYLWLAPLIVHFCQKLINQDITDDLL